MHQISVVWRPKLEQFNRNIQPTDGGQGNQCTNELLELLPNIQSLEISTSSRCAKISPDFLRKNSALKLEQLSSTQCNYFEDISAFLRILTLTLIRLEDRRMQNCLENTYTDISEDCQNKRVTILDLGSMHLPVWALNRLHKTLPSITKLKAGVPYRTRDIMPYAGEERWILNPNPSTTRTYEESSGTSHDTDRPRS